MNILCLSVEIHDSMNACLRQRRINQRVHYTINAVQIIPYDIFSYICDIMQQTCRQHLDVEISIL